MPRPSRIFRISRIFPSLPVANINLSFIILSSPYPLTLQSIPVWPLIETVQGIWTVTTYLTVYAFRQRLQLCSCSALTHFFPSALRYPSPSDRSTRLSPS